MTADPAKLDEAAERFLQNDPEYRRIVADLAETKADHDRAARIVRKKGSDPAVRHHREQYDELRRDLNAYRVSKLPELREQVASGTVSGRGSTTPSPTRPGATCRSPS